MLFIRISTHLGAPMGGDGSSPNPTRHRSGATFFTIFWTTCVFVQRFVSFLDRATAVALPVQRFSLFVERHALSYSDLYHFLIIIQHASSKCMLFLRIYMHWQAYRYTSVSSWMILIRMHAFHKDFHTFGCPNGGWRELPKSYRSSCRYNVFHYLLNDMRFRTVICITFWSSYSTHHRNACLS